MHDIGPLCGTCQETCAVASDEAPDDAVESNGAAKTWIRDAKGTRAINASQFEHMSQLTDATSFVLPRDIPADAKVTGKEKIGDKDAWVAVTTKSA